MGAEEVGSPMAPSGLAARVALAAAGAGAAVEIVTRLGEDPAGDDVLLAFAAASVGHVATLRDAVHATPVHATTEDPLDPDGLDDIEAAGDDGPGPTAGAAGTEAGRGAAVSGGTERDSGAAAGGPSGGARPTLDAADVSLALRYLDDYRVIIVVHPPDDGVVREVVAATDWATAHLVIISEPSGPIPGDLPADAVLLAVPDDAEGIAAIVGRYAATVDSGEAPAAAFRAIVGSLGAGAG